MKKQLLLGALALGSFWASAQNVLPGTPLESLDDLTTGYYFINARSNNVEGFVCDNGGADRGFISTMGSIPTEGISEYKYVFHLTVTEGEDGKTFTVQNLASGKYFSYLGLTGESTQGSTANYAKQNISGVDADDSTIAHFAASAITTEIPNVQFTEGQRFAWYLTNATFDNNGSDVSYVHSNTHSGRQRLSYWRGGSNFGTGTCAAIVFVPAQMTPTEVTFIVPAPFDGLDSYEYVKSMPQGASLADAITPIDYFTFTGFDGDVTSASGDKMTVRVKGTWSFPVNFGQAYRMDIRQNANKAYYDGSVFKSANAASANFTSYSLFYLNPESFTNGKLGVSLRSIAVASNQGFVLATEGPASKPDDIPGEIGENPTVFYVVSNTTGNDGISLQHSQNAQVHINDINGNLGGWRSVSSKNDRGSFLRFYALTDADWANDSWTHNGITINFDADAKAAAQANPTPENLRALFNVPARLIGATSYKNTVGIDYTETDGTINVPGFAAASSAKALYDALVNDESSDDDILTQVATLNSNSPAFAYEPTEGAIYTFLSTDGDTRGYLCHYNGLMTNTSASAAVFDAASDDFRFVFVVVDGKKYLYNLGAQKFMNAFGEKTDNTWPAIRDNADYTWRFADVATEIRSLINFQDAKPHSLTISAGLTPVSNSDFSGVHEGGLSMTDSGTRPNIVSMGITDRNDGNGLYMGYVGSLSEEQIAAIKANLTTAHERVASDRENASFNEESEIVNHYAEAIPAFAETDGHDFVDYTLSNLSRHQIVEDNVYTIKDESGNAWTFNDAKQPVLAPIDSENPKAYQWLAVMDGENMVLRHYITEAEAPAIATYATPEAVDMAVPALSANLGKVTLDGAEYVMTKAGQGESDATTTGIEEITAAGSDARVIYDLQGRRLAAPAKGINIINGKKVLVK